MKNYIEILTQQEKEAVIRIIGAWGFKDWFKKTTKEFNRIKPGFRPVSLSDEDALAVALNNMNDKYIVTYVNDRIDQWLGEIDSYYCNLKNTVGNEAVALANTLSKSVFCDEPQLFFKLSEMVIPTTDCDLFFETVKKGTAVEKLESIVSSSQNGTGITEKAIEELEKKHRDEQEKTIKEYEGKLKDYEGKLETVRSIENSQRGKIERLQNEIRGLTEGNQAIEKKLKEYKRLIEQGEAEENFEPAPGYHYVSLCVCYTDDNGRDRMKRIADIRDNEFSSRLLESAPDYRNLFRKDGPSEDGHIGVWDWRVVPNNVDPSKDYIESQYNNRVHPIEVCVLSGCTTIKDVVNKLKSGINVELHSDRVIFACFNGNYTGVYCENNYFDDKAKNILLKPNVMKLSVFAFRRVDLVNYENIDVLSKTTLGVPVRTVMLKNPREIVRDRIVARVTWSALQQQGFVRNEYQKIKGFLNDVPTEDLLTEICEYCECDLEDARAYFHDFQKNANEALEGQTLENKVMAQVIRNDSQLYSECINQVRREWEAQNESDIADAKEKTAELQRDLEEKRKEIERKKQELGELERQFSETKKKIDERETLISDVERKVSERIEKARKEVADFIAENAFVRANLSAPSTVENRFVSETTSTEEISFIAGKEYDSTEADINSNYTELLSTINNEMQEAGVAESYAGYLAAYLYAAYVERMPVLLAGPNSEDIAEAFSIALECRRPSRLICEGSFSRATIKSCRDSCERIVIVQQPFSVEWRDSVIELLASREKFYIVTCPIVEDLIVEPKGLFNYCLPILTDLLVESLPTKKYFGGRLIDGFQHYANDADSDQFDKLLKKLKAGPLTRKSIRKLSTDIHGLLQEKSVDVDYLLLLYPLAYVYDELPEIAEWIGGTEAKPSSRLQESIQTWLGDNNE